MLRDAIIFSSVLAALAMSADRTSTIATASASEDADLSADAWPFPEDDACYACVETCEYDQALSEDECRWATCREMC